jgi:nucleotide-binding universal stress UspA family protein
VSYNHLAKLRKGQKHIEEALEMCAFPTRILLAIDDSGEAELATQKAVYLAGGTDSELHVVHVGQLPDFLMHDPDVMGFNRKLYDKVERESQEVLRKLTWRVKLSGGTASGSHLRLGSVAEEIVKLAQELGVDLIVMGSRGHAGIRRMIEGSISDLVVHRAHCPVMIVRADKGEEHQSFWRRVFSTRTARFR